MRWLEQRIRRYEHGRWTVDNNRRVIPFSWGLEHIGGPSAQNATPSASALVPGLPPVLNSSRPAPPADPGGEDARARAFLEKWVPETIARSDAWYACTSASDYRLEEITDERGRPALELQFTSSIESPVANNNVVAARFFPAKKSGPAVVVLPQWNAKPHAQMDICRWLNTLGISALRLSLPYHDSRTAPGHERADQLVGTNIGLTLQANRQAVQDVRRCLRWLELRGYHKLGLLGTSIGSSIAFIAMAHDPAVRAAAFLHCSTYFGDVVRMGMTTAHVWEGLRGKVTGEELRRFWEPISPVPYVPRAGRNASNGAKGHAPKPRCLVITGDYDPTFLPELSQQALAGLRKHDVDHESLQLPCGHYSLGEAPFKWLVGGRFGMFFLQTLT